jgi:predicted transcriptional regulator
MSKPVVISARIDAETAAVLVSMAASRQRSRAFIQEGLDDIAAGGAVPHEDVMAWLVDRYSDAFRRAEANGSRAA